MKLKHLADSQIRKTTPLRVPHRSQRFATDRSFRVSDTDCYQVRGPNAMRQVAPPAAKKDHTEAIVAGAYSGPRPAHGRELKRS